jgi:tetratricopeptide (TPR) repeat protein
MKNWRMIGVGLVCFALGTVAQTGIAQKKNDKPTFSADMVRGKDPKAAAAALLDGAQTLAGTGSWERIAVGRAWYLGGDKAKGQQIFDAVISGSKKPEASDLSRIARIYIEANEWDKAQASYEKAIAADPGDDTGAIEYAAEVNLHKDRSKAEALFAKTMSGKKASEFWHWVNAGGSYLGVKPQ